MTDTPKLTPAQLAALAAQPMPTEGQTDVTENLIGWLRERQAKGIATYGRSLQTFNGRDPIRDLREELLDALQYIHQWELERQTLLTAAQSLAAIQGTGDLADLAREYAPPHVPPCPVCGRLMSLFRYHSGSFYQCTLCVEEGRSHERIKTTLAFPDTRVVAALAELARARERIAALERQVAAVAP